MIMRLLILIYFSVLASPIDVTEKLFFAIFGQKDADDFTIALGRGQQPPWTIYVFKVYKKKNAIFIF